MPLLARALLGLFFLALALSAAIFIPAGTTHYWQGWAFLSVFTLCTAFVTAYLARRDEGLLQRRVSAGPVAEARRTQKIVQGIAQLAFLALFIVSALDHRHGWTRVPTVLCLAGDVLVAAGLLFVFFVFRANSYASATIEVGSEQKVISTGPYAYVRHPMYSGALLMLAGVPLALGSLVGFAALLPMVAVIVARLIDEERFLASTLEGYRAYCEQVRYRLVPHLF